MRKISGFLFVLLSLFATICFADTENLDNRYLVTPDIWATEPYNKFVYFLAGEKFLGHFYPDGHCSAQYIAPNLILSAGHCLGGKKAKYHAVNYREEEFEIVPVYTEYGKESAEAYGFNDWAVWLIKNPKYFSDTYFEPYKITQQTDFINAGWGWVRIMTNDEIENIFDVLYSLYGKEADNMTVKEIAKKLRTEMKDMGIPPLEETKLMASRCHSIEQENCEETKKRIR